MQPTHAPGPPGLADYGLLLLLGLIWGASFTFIKVAVSTVPAIPTTLMRITVTVVLMVGLLYWLGHRLPPWGRTWRFVAFSALLGNALPFLLIAWGEEKVDGALAAILMSPSPLAAAVLAHFFTADEKLNRYKVAGIALGVVGIVVLMGFDTLTRLGDNALHQLAILAAGVCYGANVVINRGLTGGSAFGNVTGVMLVSMAILAPLGLVPGVWEFTPSTYSLAAIVTLAILSTCIGTLMMLNIVRRQGAAFTAQVNFLVPLFGVLVGALLLAERPHPRAFAGLALILIGVAIARRGSGMRKA
jgi:drug/metabolite transporter (DMT)-like permease